MDLRIQVVILVGLARPACSLQTVVSIPALLTASGGTRTADTCSVEHACATGGKHL